MESNEHMGKIILVVADRNDMSCHERKRDPRGSQPPTAGVCSANARETYRGPLAVGTHLIASDLRENRVNVIANLARWPCVRARRQNS